MFLLFCLCSCFLEFCFGENDITLNRVWHELLTYLFDDSSFSYLCANSRVTSLIETLGSLFTIPMVYFDSPVGRSLQLLYKVSSHVSPSVKTRRHWTPDKQQWLKEKSPKQRYDISLVNMSLYCKIKLTFQLIIGHWKWNIDVHNVSITIYKRGNGIDFTHRV